MIILALFIFSALAEVPVLAKVVDDFGACGAFFFESTEPQGMDQNATKICQQYGGRDFYVSLYSTFHRIPIYSAYIFNSSCQNQSGGKSGYWFIEPQVSSPVCLLFGGNFEQRLLYVALKVQIQTCVGKWWHFKYILKCQSFNSFPDELTIERLPMLFVKAQIMSCKQLFLLKLRIIIRHTSATVS